MRSGRESSRCARRPAVVHHRLGEVAGADAPATELARGRLRLPTPNSRPSRKLRPARVALLLQPQAATSIPRFLVADCGLFRCTLFTSSLSLLDADSSASKPVPVEVRSADLAFSRSLLPGNGSADIETGCHRPNLKEDSPPQHGPRPRLAPARRQRRRSWRPGGYPAQGLAQGRPTQHSLLLAGTPATHRGSTGLGDRPPRGAASSGPAAPTPSASGRVDAGAGGAVPQPSSLPPSPANRPLIPKRR